jgi:hypothetical protein
MLVDEEKPEPELFELPEIVSETVAMPQIPTAPVMPVTPAASWQTAAPKPPRWFCRIRGEQLGPFDLPKLTRMVDAGELAPTDRVRLEDEARWITADGIEGLFDGTPALMSKVSEGHVSAQRLFPASSESRLAPESAETPEDKGDFELESPVSAAPTPPPAKKSSGKPKKKKSKLSQDDILDILSESDEPDEDEASRSAVRPERASGIVEPPSPVSAAPAMPAYVPPAPMAPRPMSPPPPPRAFSPPPPPPKASRSSSGSSLSSMDLGEMLSSPTVKIVAALVVILPALWFGWSRFGGALLGKNAEYYVGQIEQAMAEIKKADAAGFAAACEKAKPVFEGVAKGNWGSSDEKKTLLYHCAANLYPRLAKSTDKDRERWLTDIDKTLTIVKSLK